MVNPRSCSATWLRFDKSVVADATIRSRRQQDSLSLCMVCIYIYVFYSLYSLYTQYNTM